MKVVVLCNESAGAGVPGPQRIRDAFFEFAVQADVKMAAGAAVTESARHALEAGVDSVVAAGGDGTVRSVAEALAGSPTPLGVLPMGTRNHFARDAGIPLDLFAAARTVAIGPSRRVDVGEVNGLVFLNNSSLGLYPHVARQRQELRDRHGNGWLVSTVRAGIQVLRRNPSVTVTVDPPGRMAPRTTPFVFVGNNAYEKRLFRLGRRRRLDGGELELYLSRRQGRAALLRLATRALTGRLDQARDFESFAGPRFTVESRRSVHHVALDGEVVRLAPPLRYRIRRRALVVKAP